MLIEGHQIQQALAWMLPTAITAADYGNGQGFKFLIVSFLTMANDQHIATNRFKRLAGIVEGLPFV